MATTQSESTKTAAGPSEEALAARQVLARQLMERAALAAKHALALDLLEKVHEPVGKYPYRRWETLYREQWEYDSFGRTTHSINCSGSCTWKVYVRNNIAFKEEQYGDYPDINSTLPFVSAISEKAATPIQPGESRATISVKVTYIIE